MDLSDLIPQAGVVAALKANSKKQAIQEMSEHAAGLLGMRARDIFDQLLQRERLGSTGVGQGVAIPHAKLATIDEICVLFARLDKPIEFDALDDEPVDLIFVLLAPEGAGADHLKALARIARLMREPGIARKLRASRDEGAIYSVLTSSSESDAA